LTIIDALARSDTDAIAGQARKRDEDYAHCRLVGTRTPAPGEGWGEPAKAV